MEKNVEAVMELAKLLQADAPTRVVPPSAGTRPITQSILPRAIAAGTRGYIERVVDQINGCYEHGWFDGCAVMMRRLLETLIIEAFEVYKIPANIKNPATGDFYYLSDLITKALSEKAWNLGRNTKSALKRLKLIGDQSAHSRRFNAHREDIDKITAEFRGVCQEFIYLAGLK